MLVTFVRYCVLFDCQWVSYTCRFYFFVIHVWHPHFPLNQWNKEVLDLTWRVIKLTIRIRKLTTTKTKQNCMVCASVRAWVRVCVSVCYFSFLCFCFVQYFGRVFRRHCAAYTPNQLLPGNSLCPAPLFLVVPSLFKVFVPSLFDFSVMTACQFWCLNFFSSSLTRLSYFWGKTKMKLEKKKLEKKTLPPLPPPPPPPPPHTHTMSNKADLPALWNKVKSVKKNNTDKACAAH